MLGHHTTAASTTDMNITFSFQSNDIGELNTVQSFWQNPYRLPEFDFNGTIVSQPHKIKRQVTPESSGQNTSTAHELNFRKEIESGTTQELADTQVQHIAPPMYDEDDILNLDANINIPEPRQSGIIRVKLIYEEPSKPIPVEDPWEE